MPKCQFPKENELTSVTSLWPQNPDLKLESYLYSIIVIAAVDGVLLPQVVIRSLGMRQYCNDSFHMPNVISETKIIISTFNMSHVGSPSIGTENFKHERCENKLFHHWLHPLTELGLDTWHPTRLLPMKIQTPHTRNSHCYSKRWKQGHL